MTAQRWVFPEWMLGLTMQQQSVLVLAARGPDGVNKFHPCKDVVRAYRAFVLKSARKGRELRMGESLDTFSSLGIFPWGQWDQAVKDYFDNVDSIPHHYHMHLLHGAEILGYKHPSMSVKERWIRFYAQGCEDAHMRGETEAELDRRLGDWDQKDWVVE